MTIIDIPREAVKEVGARIKAAAIAFTSTGAGQAWTAWARSGSLDFGRVEDAANSSIVQACALWIQTTFPEAPLQVLDPKDKPIDDHPMLDLVDYPNDYYDGALLWQATIADYTINANTYWLKIRSGAGRPIGLFWAPNWVVEPVWPVDGTKFIDHYEYRPNGKPIRYEVEDVVHFRFGLDFVTRKGVSRLRSVLGEIFTDREAQMFTAAILKNLGVPGLMVIPGNDKVTISAETATELRQEVEARYTSSGRGRAMVMRAPVDVKMMSFSPEQMQLKDVRQLPEERVAAVLGIPPGVAGLGAGISRNTFSNYAESREAAYESSIIPTQRVLASALKRQLLVDFTDDKRLNVAFDQSKVRVLQDDQDKLTTRTVAAFRGGIIDWSEARTAIGAKAEKDHEGVFLVAGTTKYTKIDDILEPPEPPAQPQPPTIQEVPNQPPKQLPAGQQPAPTKEAKPGVLTPDEVEELFRERWGMVSDEPPSAPDEPDGGNSEGGKSLVGLPSTWLTIAVGSEVGRGPGEKFNPHHGRDGRFSSAEGATFTSFRPGTTSKPDAGTNGSGAKPSSSPQAQPVPASASVATVDKVPEKPAERDFTEIKGSTPKDWDGHWDSYSGRLTTAESEALGDYSGSEYRTINKALRSDKAPSKKVQAIDSALEKGSLDRDTVMYRGGPYGQFKVGETFTDKGFGSATLDRTIAGPYTIGLDNPAIVKIYAPKGTKGAYVSGGKPPLSAYGAAEREFILPRGTSYRVTKIVQPNRVERIRGYPPTVHVELVGP